MDNLTHAITGALVCDAFPFIKQLGPKAPLAAAIIAAAPALDMVPAFIANFPPRAPSFHGLFDSACVNRLHSAERIHCSTWLWPAFPKHSRVGNIARIADLVTDVLDEVFAGCHDLSLPAVGACAMILRISMVVCIEPCCSECFFMTPRQAARNV